MDSDWTALEKRGRGGLSIVERMLLYHIHVKLLVIIHTVMFVGKQFFSLLLIFSIFVASLDFGI